MDWLWLGTEGCWSRCWMLAMQDYRRLFSGRSFWSQDAAESRVPHPATTPANEPQYNQQKTRQDKILF